MGIELVVLVYFASIVILVIEIFVVSGGVLALAGIGGLGVSIYYGFVLSTPLGIGQIVLASIILPWMFFYAMRKMTLEKKLSSQDGFHSDKSGLEHLLSKEGIALTNLRPAGVVLIEGKKVDVVTEGELIDKDASVKVVKIEGTRVVVKNIQK